MKQKTKRQIYIALFALLGVLVATIVHGLVEIWYLQDLKMDWETWLIVHRHFSIILWLLGALLGYGQGKYWWRVVYEQKRLDPFFKKLRRFVGMNS